jgi:hypothetical protein
LCAVRSVFSEEKKLSIAALPQALPGAAHAARDAVAGDEALELFAWCIGCRDRNLSRAISSCSGFICPSAYATPRSLINFTASSLNSRVNFYDPSSSIFEPNSVSLETGSRRSGRQALPVFNGVALAFVAASVLQTVVISCR